MQYKPSNYPDAQGTKSLYEAYYLDLNLQGKLDGFDWVKEKDISDAEWLAIYKSICQWSAKTVSANKPNAKTLPSNDFDLLKQFYPQLNYRDLETPFIAEEVGSNFPYKNMKELLSAALAGTLNVPGYGSVTSLESAGLKSELAALKESTFKKIDTLYEEALVYAKNPFPDEASKTHYQALREKLATFPQTPAAWAAYRANVEKEVDEMARLASKPEDPHHHHDEEEHGHEEKLSVAQEFEAKYGKNLDVMQDRWNKYKQDPEGFLEASILEKFGKNGIDIWKKSQEFSSKLSVITEADKAATEKAFSDFLKQA